MSPIRLAFVRAVLGALPFVIVIVPFGMLFGVVATEAGLNLAEVMTFSITVFAGASQFAALQLMQENAPVIVVLATSLAVNLRMVMYSIAMAPHFGAAPFGLRAVIAYFLVDQSFAASAAAFERNPRMTLAEKVATFFGAITPVAPVWYAATYTGVKLGATIPPEYALDFAVPITFLAITAPLLRSAAHVAAAVVSVVLALALAGLPSGTGLIVAAAVAMAAGVAVERRTARQADRGTGGRA